MTAAGRYARISAAVFVMSFILCWVACSPPNGAAPVAPVAAGEAAPAPAPVTPDTATMAPEDLIEHLSRGDAAMKAALEEADARVRETSSESGEPAQASRKLAIQRRSFSYTNERQEFATAEEHVARARELERTGYGPESLVHYRKATVKDPSDAMAWAGLGRMLAYTGKPEEALDAYGKALTLAPDRPGWHKEVGEAYENLGRLDEARSHYQKAVDLKPDYGEVYLRIAVTEWRRNDLPAARTALDQAERLGIDPPHGLREKLQPGKP